METRAWCLASTFLRNIAILIFLSHFVSVFVFGCVGVEGQLSGPRIQHRRLDDPHCDFTAASGDISRPTPPGCGSETHAAEGEGRAEMARHKFAPI